MSKSNASSIVKRVQTTLSKHSPEILTGIGIAGMITTTILAVRATPKALKRIENAKKEKHVDKLTPIDTIKATWKCYIPATVTCVTSTACLIGASSTHLKRNAALATAYKLSETALTEYKEKVIETIGEKKEKAVREKVAQEHIQKYTGGNTEVYFTGKGDTLFLEPISKRVFKSDVEYIRKVVNNLNYTLTHDIMGCVSLNEFYDELGLERTAIGDDMGWSLDNGNGLLDIDLFPDKTPDNQPCFSLEYSILPKYEYSSYYR